MAKIKFDKRNYRKHSDRNKQLIEKSLKELGAGRSIVIDSEDEIIAGNGIYEQARKLGIKERIIETNGDELIIVKRKDLKTEDEKRKKLALADNATSDSSEFDNDLLKEDFDMPELEEWNILTNNMFDKVFNNNNKLEVINYPITIITNENEFLKWEKLKEQYKTKNDTELFFKIVKSLKYD